MLIVFTLTFIALTAFIVLERRHRQFRRSLLAGLIASTLGLSACETVMIGALNMAEMTQLEVKGDTLYVANLLNSQTFDQMRAVIGDNPQVKTLVFTAMEGSIDDETTFAMGRWIREQGLNTHLTARSVIASGAVDLYLSGSHRTMERGAMIGVHSWSDGSKEAADYPRDSKEHALNRDYIIAMGVPEDFYWFTIYEAPADAIHWMSEPEVLKYQLPTTAISNDDTSGAIIFDNFEEMRAEILED
ncbi:MAG: hypothetical protein V3U82_05660 [Robiginitomaculum sp.]